MTFLNAVKIRKHFLFTSHSLDYTVINYHNLVCHLYNLLLMRDDDQTQSRRVQHPNMNRTRAYGF